MVSVIIPTYNRAGTLMRSVQSVMEQSYSEWELIIVDDGSTDNTKDIVKPVLEQDVRIRYIYCPENKGQASARNTGIQAAQGEYVAFQDSDDCWLPDKLQLQMSMMKAHPEYGLVYGQVVYDEGGKLSVPYPPTDAGTQVFKACLKQNQIGTPTMLVRKAVFDTIGLFDTSLAALEDYELALRITKHFPTGFVAAPVLKAYKSADSVSRDLGNHLIASSIILKKYEKDIRDNGLWDYKMDALEEMARQYDVVEDLEDIFKALKIFRGLL
ncbi:MAG: glycosyltransferase [Bacteroides sp.]|nr:glycosyltransferase [Bacteroides sp.]MCM1549016.1 glycosyltransferase [Clostridium sp.]